MADFRHLGTVQSGLCVIMQNLIKRYLERLRENIPNVDVDVVCFGLINQSVVNRFPPVGCMTSPLTNRSLVVDIERPTSYRYQGGKELRFLKNRFLGFLGFRFFLRRPMSPNTKVWPKSIWNMHPMGLIQHDMLFSFSWITAYTEGKI